MPRAHSSKLGTRKMQRDTFRRYVRSNPAHIAARLTALDLAKRIEDAKDAAFHGDDQQGAVLYWCAFQAAGWN